MYVDDTAERSRESVHNVLEAVGAKDVEPLHFLVALISDAVLSIAGNVGHTASGNLLFNAVDLQDATAAYDVVDFSVRVSVGTQLSFSRRKRCDASRQCSRSSLRR